MMPFKTQPSEGDLIVKTFIGDLHQNNLNYGYLANVFSLPIRGWLSISAVTAATTKTMQKKLDTI